MRAARRVTLAAVADPSRCRIPCSGAQFSQDGRFIALWHATGVSVYDVGSEEKVVELGEGDSPVQALAFSPLGSFMQVYHKPTGVDGEKNLKVRFSLISAAQAAPADAHAAARRRSSTRSPPAPSPSLCSTKPSPATSGRCCSGQTTRACACGW